MALATSTRPNGRAHRDVVVVTGASAGVGRATARRFARDGARIALLARGREGLDGARRDVEALGGEALVIPIDVARAKEVEPAASVVESRLGQIDVWINNAMTSVFSPVNDMEPEEFLRVTEVTYLGYVYDIELWTAIHRRWLLLAAATAGGLACLLVRGRRSPGHRRAIP